MVQYTQARIKEVITGAFQEAQNTKTCHRRLFKSLKKVYENCDFEIFFSEFIRCLKFLFVVMDRYRTVENSFEFAARFALSLQPSPNNEKAHQENGKDNEEEGENGSEKDGDDDGVEINEFLKKLFEFCLQHHAAVDLAVRYRACFFVNLLLNCMGDNAYLSDEMCEEIRDAMAARLLDKSPKVRVQAIGALYRMQEPSNLQCPIIRMYIYHMTKDASSEVRKAAIQNSAKTQKVLQAVLQRIQDVDDGVRKAAYTFISKITVRSLAMKQRQLLLRTGLNDRSENVRRVLRDTILPTWLANFQNDYCKLLYGLDTEMEPELAILVLNTMFERENVDNLFKQIPLNRDAKLIPVEELTSDNVMLWRCFIEYLHKKSNPNDLLEETVPELTTFCTYIRNFQQQMTDFANQRVPKTEAIETQTMSRKFILLQLFEITKSYDLADEVGKNNLRQLIEDTLMSENCTPSIIECIVKYYEKIVPDVSSRLTSLAHVISEIRMPTRITDNVVQQLSDDEINERRIKATMLKNRLIEKDNIQYSLAQQRKFVEAAALQQEMEQITAELQELEKPVAPIIAQTQEEEKNDPETMIKCLTIMFTMAQASSVKTLTGTLRSLFDNLALPSIDHIDGNVQAVALKAAGVCLYLDSELAKKHLMLYLVAMTADDENQQLWLISLSIIFDMFLRYGLDHFKDLINTDKTMDGGTMHETSKRNKTTKLYNNTDDTGLSLEIETGDHRTNLIKILHDLIEHPDAEVRTAATTGFCKLLLHGKIKSNELLSSLIIRLYNPVTANDAELHGNLVNFFKLYPRVTSDRGICLQQALIPTLKKLASAPENSPLNEIDPFNVAKFIIDLTSSQFHKQGDEDFAAHNQLALDILKEMANEDSELDAKILVKSLKQLVIRCENANMRNQMREAVDAVVDVIDPREGAILKYLQYFRRQLEDPEEPGVPEEAHIDQLEESQADEMHDENDEAEK